MIEKEFDDSKPEIRKEFKGVISTNKLQYKKLVDECKEIEGVLRLGSGIKEEGRINQTSSLFLQSKIDANSSSLLEGSKTAEEIITRDKMTVAELQKQGEILLGIDQKVNEAEENLTVVEQIRQVMQNNELFYRLKLWAMVVLLFFANILMLIIKFR